MCAVEADGLSRATPVPGVDVPGRRWTAPMAKLVAYWSTPAVVVVGAHGAIDVTNAHAMTTYALEGATGGRGLILDLRGLTFLGTEGFSALHRVAVGCARSGIAWALVAGPVAFRLLGICDPWSLLPTVGTVDAALASVEEQIPLSLRTSRDNGTRTRLSVPAPLVQ